MLSVFDFSTILAKYWITREPRFCGKFNTNKWSLQTLVFALVLTSISLFKRVYLLCKTFEFKRNLCNRFVNVQPVSICPYYVGVEFLILVIRASTYKCRIIYVVVISGLFKSLGHLLDPFYTHYLLEYTKSMSVPLKCFSPYLITSSASRLYPTRVHTPLL